MINFGLLTPEQAMTSCAENVLMFDLWEIIAPRVERDLAHIDEEFDEANENDVT